MKTRIMYPKNIWFNKSFASLSITAKVLALYLVSNENIGLLPIYKCFDREICFSLQYSEKQLEDAKKQLEQTGLFQFYKEWVHITNDFSYCDYHGRDRVEESRKKEESSIPIDVSNYFKGLKTGYKEVINLSLNHKSINNNSISFRKSENLFFEKDNQFKKPSQEKMQEIAQKYSVPLSFVLSKLDDIENWEEEKPGRMKGRNWTATLRNWVKRDSIKIKQGGQNVRTVIDARQLK